MEIWRTVKNSEYKVSNTGKVKSPDREEVMTWIKGNPKRIINGKELVQSKKDGKYRVCSVCINGRIKQVYVHRIVAECFHGEIKKGMVINHIDGNIDNNNSINLEIVSQRDNSIHSNIKKGKSSKYVGVYFNKARKIFVAMARPKGSKDKVYLGSFKNEYDAFCAYKEYVGKFDNLKYLNK